MTSMSGSPARNGNEDRSTGVGSSQPDGSPGVELGMSDGTAGTFEPEEDPVEDDDPDG